MSFQMGVEIVLPVEDLVACGALKFSNRMDFHVSVQTFLHVESARADGADLK